MVISEGEGVVPEINVLRGKEAVPGIGGSSEGMEAIAEIGCRGETEAFLGDIAKKIVSVHFDFILCHLM